MQYEWLIKASERDEIATAVNQKKEDMNLKNTGPATLKKPRTEGAVRAMEATMQMLKRGTPSSSSLDPS